MTDTVPTLDSEKPVSKREQRRSIERQRQVRQRFKAEARFKYLGLGSVLLAAGFLVLLLSTVIGNGLPAFQSHTIALPLDFSVEKVDPEDAASADYRSLINDSLKQQLPFVSGRKNRKLLRGLVSSGAPTIAQASVIGNDALLGKTSDVSIPLSDTADLYFKGLLANLERRATTGNVVLSGDKKNIEITTESPVFESYVSEARLRIGENAVKLRERIVALGRSVDRYNNSVASAQAILSDPDASQHAKTRATALVGETQAKIEAVESERQRLAKSAEKLEARASSTSGSEKLTRDDPSLFLEINGGIIKISEAGPTHAKGEVLVPPNRLNAKDDWTLATVNTPEAERKLSDKEIAWLEHLNQADVINSGWNTILFTRGASREAEMAGIWGAVIGSLLTMLVTLALSFPPGIAAAIYLEEFAPKNRLTDFIEVNINNLAAVPSIVFGLLGLGIFINGVNLGWFTLGGGFPRSASITGGTVLALMTLPTIIIASRAALRAVPPSIREAALGIGASRVQTVFHHVLPLAMPGMLTGTIIGMAQALGETAPLLMIGMVAFIVDIPGGFTDPATVLPVQIYMWADFPETAFQQKTAAAIMILLGFLVIMNALAVLLRKRFERRW